MTKDKLKQIMEDHDFVIIPLKNVECIKQLSGKFEGMMGVAVKPSEDSGDYMHFVDSDYFVAGWGKK